MRFWDTSAIIPLVTSEPARAAMLSRLEEDPEVLFWWGTPVEIVSALARREREGHLDADDVAHAVMLLRRLSDAWSEIVPSEAVRRMAKLLLRVHTLCGRPIACNSPRR